MKAFLPARPLRLRPSFVARSALLGGVFLVLGAAIAFFGGRWVWVDEVQGILRDKEVWATGAPAMGGKVDGQEKSNQFILYSYDLKVEYRDAWGKDRSGTSSFSLLFSSLDTARPPAVRYDPKSPDQFTVSWAMDELGARWGAAGLYAFGVLALSGSLLLIGWGASRRLLDARRVAEQSDEVRLFVVSRTQQVVNGQVTGATIYRYSVPEALGGDGKTEQEIVLARGEAPLFADEGGNVMVALVSPIAKTRPVVVRRDLYPFDFTADEAREIRERMQAEGPLGG
jgi:hypothetical protein